MPSLPRPRSLSVSLAVLALAGLSACQGRSPSIADAGPAGPSLVFVGLPASVGCEADANAEADGFQLEVSLELADDDGSGFAQVLLANSRNNATATTPLADGTVTMSIEVVPEATPGAENTLTATATNDSGRVLEASAVVLVECEIPPPSVTCAFTAPAANAVIAADHTEVALTCTSTGLNAAQRDWLGSAQLRIDATPAAGGTTLSRELDLVGGSASGDVSFPSTGEHDLSATVLDPDDLLDPDPTVSIAVDVQP